MTALRVTIGGMTCTHCVRAVRTQLEALEGVAVERVEVGSATLTYDPARVSPSAVLAAIADAGYEPAADGAIDEAGAGA